MKILKKLKLLYPIGYIAIKESNLIKISIILLSIIIIPTIILSWIFAFKYYKKNNNKYLPNWNYSLIIELIIWIFPIIIILILSYLTFVNTKILDPRNINIKKKILKINTISLDWKWFFIICKYKIAIINEIVVPINKIINFNITSLNNMNSFNIPSLSGQIYSMPNMTTQLNSFINKTSFLNGFSSNYSGEGFSDMNFNFYSLKKNDYFIWIKSIYFMNKILNNKKYLLLLKKSFNNKINYFNKIYIK
ncbi:putative cytochrome bo terminal oxidase subunit II [Candidatus Zinderia insecticola CARI]|uniref:Putative cytochrome bo terminal oxidase subunit II n=1 Tax=Zinderia insecticola (strain CARI) TaxID=871271 RepID=E0TIN9_ZINIC|nr:putative cytochrome bo terminal oxidase subunit II [Candidatus Zinderia insecticola CARI]